MQSGRDTRSKQWVGAACGIAAWVIFAGCKGEAPPEKQPVAVRVQLVQRSQGAGGTRYSATIRPDAQVDLAFKVSGYVDGIQQVRGADGRMRNVQDGDVVRKETPLAHVRDNEYRDRLAEGQASLTKAKADYERAARMYENKTISKADYDAAFAQAQATQARYDQAAVTLGDCVLRTPMDGTMIQRTIEIGSLVSPGAPAFTVADTRAVKAAFGVPDVALGAIQMGDSLAVVTEAVPGRTFLARVTRIAPSADASRVFEVECTIPNPDGRLKSGMIAALGVAGDAARATSTLVPLKAIVRPKNDPKAYGVYVVEEADGKQIARVRPVLLGEVDGNSIVVTQGLQGGERVVVTGATLVTDQQEVHVVP